MGRGRGGNADKGEEKRNVRGIVRAKARMEKKPRWGESIGKTTDLSGEKGTVSLGGKGARNVEQYTEERETRGTP